MSRTIPHKPNRHARPHDTVRVAHPRPIIRAALGGARGSGKRAHAPACQRSPSAYPHAPTFHRHIERRAFVNSVSHRMPHPSPHQSPPRASIDESHAPSRPAVRCQAASLAEAAPRRMLGSALGAFVAGEIFSRSPSRILATRRMSRGILNNRMTIRYHFTLKKNMEHERKEIIN